MMSAYLSVSPSVTMSPASSPFALTSSCFVIGTDGSFSSVAGCGVPSELGLSPPFLLFFGRAGASASPLASVTGNAFVSIGGLVTVVVGRAALRAAKALTGPSFVRRRFKAVK